MPDYPFDPRHPRTALTVETTVTDWPFDEPKISWARHGSLSASRPVVKRIAQALADATGSRVKAVRDDATGFTRIYTPTTTPNHED